jgi:hypothetical protein
MKQFTPEEKRAIRDYFDSPNYDLPHAEIMVMRLLSAMIQSGKYQLEEYPRLAEASVKLTAILAVQFHNQLKGEAQEVQEVRETTTPKPPASEEESMNSDSEAYDPIPF